MKRINYTFLFLLCAVLPFISCGSSNKNNAQENETEEQALVKAPDFNADSAYTYIADQVAFGPRVPNTAAHRSCGEYLAKKLEGFGAKVYNQQADLVAYDGTILKSRNIIGAYNPESKKRVMLCAHWDSRPYADNGEEKYHHTPIDGANDGASGVGVLLEIARQIQQKAPAIGIDIIFFDAEDYGTPDFYQGMHQANTWCLGSQYWGRIPHVADYKARYGILLDMVGGKNATFYYEDYSKHTANKAMKKIWKTADKLGYSNYFIKQDGGSVVDDHMYVNQLRQIPCVDIIDYNPNTDTGFNPTWHTIDDNIKNIDKATLQAVGQTVMTVIYNEK
ncbi:M28 family peptidase [uncultured Bacteroides sp.]|uniref:M20 family metallopeptidase n=1 Tax=uncultured Bacteroides sp. TaxID=162156 RepID=UPI00262C75B9|nr:M28 family peptidase [uncultured Bacteroides sp.]